MLVTYRLTSGARRKIDRKCIKPKKIGQEVGENRQKVAWKVQSAVLAKTHSFHLANIAMCQNEIMGVLLSLKCARTLMDHFMLDLCRRGSCWGPFRGVYGHTRGRTAGGGDEKSDIRGGFLFYFYLPPPPLGITLQGLKFQILDPYFCWLMGLRPRLCQYQSHRYSNVNVNVKQY